MSPPPASSRPVPRAPLPSLRARVLRHVLWPLALSWLIGTAVTVGVAYYYAQQAFDRALLDDAYALASRVTKQADGLTFDLSTDEMSTVLFDQSEDVFFVVQHPDGVVLAGHPGLHAPLPGAQERVRFSEVTYRGARLRSVSLRRRQPEPFFVVVAQTMGSRQALLHKVLLYSSLSQALLLLGLAAWLRRVIGDEIKPLSDLQQSVDRRDALDLTPVPVSATSSDIEHLGRAINALLARVNHSMSAQREFSGNVAHELRTPLAGIRALAEYGLAHTEPAVWREQLQRIGVSEARASRLVEQLLALALAEEADARVPTEAVDLVPLVRETVLRYLPRADAAGVDLGVDMDESIPFQVQGNAALLEGILGNLLDNALRYGAAPAGQTSHVTVQLQPTEAGVALAVLDNGPGLSREDSQRLLQRGVRGVHAAPSDRLGEGAGLGLAIVTRFAGLMQARFTLGANPDGPGLRACLLFPPVSSERAVPAQ